MCLYFQNLALFLIILAISRSKVNNEGSTVQNCWLTTDQVSGTTRRCVCELNRGGNTARGGDEM
jgi:hypothetical protein